MNSLRPPRVPSGAAELVTWKSSPERSPTGIASREVLLAELRRRIRSDFVALNERALEAGLQLGARAMAPT